MISKSLLKKIFMRIVLIKTIDNDIVKSLKKSFIHKERSFIHGYFKRMADCIYCHASPGVIEETLTGLHKLKSPENHPRLLNLGGGTGQVAAILESLGYDVTNVDLDIAPEDQSPKNITFNLNSTEKLPVESHSFDIVLCQEIIEHVENPWQLFRTSHSLLKTDGLLILSTPNVRSKYSRLLFFLTGYMKWFTPACFSYHINPMADWEIKLIAQKTGFILKKIKGNSDYILGRESKNERELVNNNEELIYYFQPQKVS